MSADILDLIFKWLSFCKTRMMTLNFENVRNDDP